MTALEAIVNGLFWLSMLALLLRWPGRTLGFAAALLAWTVVGPWAFWTALGLVLAGAVGWRRYGPEESLVRRYPLVGLFVTAAGVALVSRGVVSLVALGVAVGALGGLGWSAPWARHRESALPVRAAGGPSSSTSTSQTGVSGRGVFGGGAWLVDETTCECGGRVTAMGRAAPGPAGGLMAWASCARCDRRFLGFTDEAGELTWFEVPAERMGESA